MKIQIRFTLTLFASAFCLLGLPLAAAPAAQADCSAAPSGITFRIWTAPSWCPHCVHQRDFMASQRWTRYIPMRINNGEVIRINVQACDVDDKANSRLADAQGVSGYPTSQVLIDGQPVGSMHPGAMTSVPAYETYLRQTIPGADQGRLPLPLAASLAPETHSLDEATAMVCPSDEN